jgi:hypothetical protein
MRGLKGVAELGVDAELIAATAGLDHLYPRCQELETRSTGLSRGTRDSALRAARSAGGATRDGDERRVGRTNYVIRRTIAPVAPSLALRSFVPGAADRDAAVFVSQPNVVSEVGDVSLAEARGFEWGANRDKASRKSLLPQEEAAAIEVDRSALGTSPDGSTRRGTPSAQRSMNTEAGGPDPQHWNQTSARPLMAFFVVLSALVRVGAGSAGIKEFFKRCSTLRLLVSSRFLVVLLLFKRFSVCNAADCPVGVADASDWEATFPVAIARAACAAFALQEHPDQVGCTGYKTYGCGCETYITQGGTLSGCLTECMLKRGGCGCCKQNCYRGCESFHNQPCTGNGYSTNPNFTPVKNAYNYLYPNTVYVASNTDRWSDKCVASSSSTTRTVSVIGCSSQPTSNMSTNCDWRGNDTITLSAFGFGCTLSTPYPIVTIGDSLMCTNVRVPSIVQDPSCANAAVPQYLSCTLPSVPSSMFGLPLAIRVKWVQNTKVSYLNKFAGGHAPANITALKTTNAKSEASISFSCLDRTCNGAGIPHVSWIKGCKGDRNYDVTGMSKSWRRADNCLREGGTRITIHGHFLKDANITVGGEPCRDIVHDVAKPEEIATCVLPCAAGNRDQWIEDPLRRAFIDRAHTNSSGWKFDCVYTGVLNGVLGGSHRGFSQLDAIAPNGIAFSGWCAATDDGTQHLELDLGSVQKIGGVETQGRSDMNEWTTGFVVELAGLDHVFTVVAEFGVQIGQAPVNTDRNTKVKSSFALPMYGRYVRITPKTWATTAGVGAGWPSLRADVLLGSVAGGYVGSTNAQHVIACTQFGCSPTAENTRITFDETYDPASPHLCWLAPEIESAAVVNGALELNGRGFGAGAALPVEMKSPFRIRYGVDTDAVCDLTDPGRVTTWSQTKMVISLAHSSSSWTKSPTMFPTAAPTVLHSALPSGAWGIWTASSWGASSPLQWDDLSGNNRHANVTRGTPSLGSADGISFVQGGTADGVRFPTGSIPSSFTIFVVARYKPGASAKKRIFDAVMPLNTLHGFDSGKSGVVYYGESWKTAQTDRSIGDEWLVIGGRNGGTQMILVNGINRATGSGGAGGGTLTINHGKSTGERSEWQVRDVVVWDRSLTDTEMNAASSLLMGSDTSAPTAAPIAPTAAPTTETPCATMLDKLYALPNNTPVPEPLQLQLGGSRIGCYPPNAPCIRSVSGCAGTGDSDIASTKHCSVEGGRTVTVRGRNLDATVLHVKSDSLAASIAKNKSTTSAVNIVSFVRGGSESNSIFELPPTEDELTFTLPCLYPKNLVWGTAISLVSGNATEVSTRSLPTLGFEADYNATIPYVCYLDPVVESVNPTVVKPGDLVTLAGRNFGAFSPRSSSNKLLLNALVNVGAEQCNSFVDATWSATSIQFEVCSGAGKELALSVTLGSKNSVSSGEPRTLSYYICAPGERSEGMECVPCKPGFYGQLSAGNSKECKQCGLGYMSNVSGRVNCDKCEIDHVTGLNLTATGCNECKDGAIADEAQATCRTCEDGKYRIKKPPFAATCNECPDGLAARRISCRKGKLAIKKGSWYPFETDKEVRKDTEMHACFNDEACLYTNDQRDLACAGKLGYFGPLCGACDRDNGHGHGHFTRSGNGCAGCWHLVGSWFAFIGLGILVAVLVVYLVVQHSFAAAKGEYGATVQKVAISYIQMLGVLGIFKARGTAVFNEMMARPAEVVGGSITSMLPIKCALESQIYGPFIANMALPPLIFTVAIIVLIPKAIYEYMVRKGRADAEAPVYKGKLNIPRKMAIYRVMREPMTAGDIIEWRGEFFPMQRLAGVTAFVLFGLYPTLVKSIASLFNCTENIEGVQYLVADLTVVCYKGRHTSFLIAGIAGTLIYAIGIPIAVALATALKTPIYRNAENKLRVRCKRRAHAKYSQVDVRARFAFLFNGYSTDRSGFVVAWEAIVMLRKLTVTLAGSTIKDPYLQILVALMILVVSCVATAFVQPYEKIWLNLLDTAGLFALITTQILSIVYFYAENAAQPFMDPEALETLVTVSLICLNVVVLLFFAGLFAVEMAGLREKCEERESDVLKIAEHTLVDVAHAGEARREDVFWHHPSGVAVRDPPTRDAMNLIWIWKKEGIANAFSTTKPELLLTAQSDLELDIGDAYRWMNKKTNVLSDVKTRMHDVGGRTCRKAKPPQEDGDVEMIAVQAKAAPPDYEEEEAEDVADAPVVEGRRGDEGEVGDESSQSQAIIDAAQIDVREDNAFEELQSEITQLTDEIKQLRSENAELKAHSEDSDAAIAELQLEILRLEETQHSVLNDLPVTPLDDSAASPVDAGADDDGVNTSPAMAAAPVVTTSATSADDKPLDENPRLSRVGVIDAIEFEVPQHDATARISLSGASNPLRAKRVNIDGAMHSSATDAPALPKRPSSRATPGRRKAGSHGRGSILHLQRDGNLRGIVARNALKFKAADAALTLTAEIDTTSDSVPDVLPLGWEEHVAEDGDSYYHNEGTNETVWARPTIESVDEGSLLPGWEEHIAENGESYYHKEATNETVWARPTAQNNALSVAMASEGGGGGEGGQ